ncbi:MAG: DUF5330 domain-containing protein [Methyloceanibacter sp.]|uniref:DUF5330 domain-containing protein n=1 Tax=Methyloceanibacter sp. TaxID=1965321 RepID=UPI003D6D21A4
MMFLIRTAFWLMILVLLLPTDEEQQNQIYGTAQAAFNDVASFCDRNPQTCATGQEVFAVFVQKTQYGAELVMTMVEEHTASTGNGVPGPVAMPGGGGVMPVPAAAPLAPTTWDETNSQDTLSPDDREAAWGGPDV